MKLMSHQPLDWDRLLDGGRYLVDTTAAGYTLPTLRAKAHQEANNRGTIVRTHRLPESTKLVIQAFAFQEQAPSEHVVMELPQVPFTESRSGLKELAKALGPAQPPVPEPPLVRFAEVPSSESAVTTYEDPDDYDDPDNEDWPQAACTCGAWPQDQPSCRLFDTAAFQLWRQQQPSSEPAAPAPSAPVITGPTRDASTCTCGRYPDCGAECFNFDPALLLEP